MPKETDADWVDVAGRLARVPAAVASVRDGVSAAVELGRPPALRQLEATVQQCRTWAGEPGSGGWFAGLAAVRPDLHAAAVAAGEALRELGTGCRREVAPRARTTDGVGEEQYVRAARVMLGSELDPREAYDVGVGGGRTGSSAEIRTVIDQIRPGATLVETKAHLDEITAVDGAEQWRAWLQELTDRTTQELRGTHFEIDEQLIRCEAMLPPAGVAAAPYYSPPSEDLVDPGPHLVPDARAASGSRPGR